MVGYTEVWKVGYMETPFTDYLGSLWTVTENTKPSDSEYSVGYCRGLPPNNFNLWKESDYRIYANSLCSLTLCHFCGHDRSLARS